VPLHRPRADEELGADLPVRVAVACEPRDFSLRQLWDSKTAADVARMRPADMAHYAKLCAWTLARAHARAGDSIAIAASLGSSDVFDRAIGGFAQTYSDQHERDHAALLGAIAAGRVKAQEPSRIKKLLARSVVRRTRWRAGTALGGRRLPLGSHGAPVVECGHDDRSQSSADDRSGDRVARVMHAGVDP